MNDRQKNLKINKAPESNPIYYSDRITPVMLGDVVETYVWFRKHRGRVVYVPGISKLNPEMERDGLKWIGIRLDEGGFMGQVVDPDGNFLVKPVILLKRDRGGFNELGQEEDPFGNDSFPTP